MDNNDRHIHEKREKLISELSLIVDEIVASFETLNLDDYEAECFYKGLSDTRAFVNNLNWLIKHHNKE